MGAGAGGGGGGAISARYWQCSRSGGGAVSVRYWQCSRSGGGGGGGLFPIFFNKNPEGRNLLSSVTAFNRTSKFCVQKLKSDHQSRQAQTK